jgi:hypothetical protein
MSQVIHSREALDLSARAMDDAACPWPDDFVTTIYVVAGQLAAHKEVDQNISVPDWLVERYAVTELQR